jgi:hypothetical protein
MDPISTAHHLKPAGLPPVSFPAGHEGNEFCVEMSRAELDAALAAENSE